MDAWLPGYERVPITGCAGNYIDVPWRMVLHTTEGSNGSMSGLIPFFQQRPCSTPHFAIDPSDRRKVQFIPITSAAAALRGGQSGYETNRARCIQTEVIGFASETHTWPDEWVDFVGEHVADVVAAGVPLNLDREVRFLGQGDGVLATTSAAQRMTPDQWHAFDGVCGHQHVPFNDHWDPGRLNINRVLATARGDQEDDDMGWNSWTPEDRTQMLLELEEHLAKSDKIKNQVASGALYGVSGMAKNAGKDYAKVGTNNGDLFNAIMALGSGGGQVDVAKLADALRANLSGEILDDLADRLKG